MPADAHAARRTPAIDAAGNLSFRPADGVVGSAEVTVRLMENDGGVVQYSDPVTFTIGVEQPVIWATATGESRLEGDGQITFTVTLSWKPVGPVSVDWSLADGTAEESDYGHTWQEAWTEDVPVPGYDVTVHETYTLYWNNAYEIVVGEESG